MIIRDMDTIDTIDMDTINMDTINMDTIDTINIDTIEPKNDLEAPLKMFFTIYSKSGCPNCLKVKDLLKSKHLNFKVINCDDFLLENKEDFLEQINKFIHTQDVIKVFPFVFYNEKYIGGYKETIDYTNNLLLSFEDLTF